MTAIQIDELETLAKMMERDIETAGNENYIVRNYNFHFSIYAASQNEELFWSIERLWAHHDRLSTSDVPGARETRAMAVLALGALCHKDHGVPELVTLFRKAGWSIDTFPDYDKRPALAVARKSKLPRTVAALQAP